MARQPEPGVVKVELRLSTADPETRLLLEELRREAAATKSSLPDHIELLLLHRYRARRGQAFLDALWVPGGGPYAPPSPSPVAPVVVNDDEGETGTETARQIGRGFMPKRRT